jgi:hypothetical protein
MLASLPPVLPALTFIVSTSKFYDNFEQATTPFRSRFLNSYKLFTLTKNALYKKNGNKKNLPVSDLKAD